MGNAFSAESNREIVSVRSHARTHARTHARKIKAREFGCRVDLRKNVPGLCRPLSFVFSDWRVCLLSLDMSLDLPLDLPLYFILNLSFNLPLNLPLHLHFNLSLNFPFSLSLDLPFKFAFESTF